jgi:MFS transporter, DHA3 family, macrolide efflux protein
MKSKNILISAFFSSFGSMMYFVVVAWILYELTSDAMYTGWMVGLGFLPGVFMNLVFGIWVDRANRKTLTIIANLVVTLAVFVLYVAILVNSLYPGIIFVVHMIVQTFSSLFRTAQQAFVSEIFDKKEIPRIFSHLGSATAVGGLIGTSVGGVALTVTSYLNVILIVCVSFIITMFSLMSIKYEVPSPRRNKVENTIFKDIFSGFTYINRQPIMYSLLTMMFMGQLIIHNTTGMLSVYTSSYLNGSVTVYGLLESATSVGAIVAGLTATYYLSKSKQFVSIGAFLVTWIGLIGMTFTHNKLLAFISIFLISIGTTWVRVLLQSVQQIATDPDYYGRMSAIRQTVNQTSVVIASPILGTVAEWKGVQYSYGVLLIPLTIIILYSLIFSKNKYFIHIIRSVVPEAKKNPKQQERVLS